MIGTDQILTKLEALNDYSLTHTPDDWLEAEGIIEPDLSRFMIEFSTLGPAAAPDAMAAFMLGWELAKDKYTAHPTPQEAADELEDEKFIPLDPSVDDPPINFIQPGDEDFSELDRSSDAS